MPYNQFNSLQALKKQLNIVTKTHSLFANLNSVEPSNWLLETLDRVLTHQVAYFSEKSRSEAIVFPILLEIQSRHEYRFGLYSGAIMEADKSIGLNGECDFILSNAVQSIELERPIFCIVEAKDNDIEMGIPQCLAQMVGAQIFNEQENYIYPIIYGAVTTGTEWLFLKLEGSTAYIDANRYYIADVAQLLGVLDNIIFNFMKLA